MGTTCPGQRSGWILTQPGGSSSSAARRDVLADALRLRRQYAQARDSSVHWPTLVVALAVVMRHEFSSRFPHRALAEQDHPLQAGFFDRPYKPFCIGVQIGTARWKLHRGSTRFAQQAQELGKKQIAIMDQVRR